MRMRMRAKVAVMSIAAFAVVNTAVVSAVELKTGDSVFPSPTAAWEFTGSPFALKQITETAGGRNYLNAPAKVCLRNGKTIEDLVPDRESIQDKDGMLTVRQDFSAIKLNAVQRVSSKDDAIQWDVNLSNTSSEELWIQVRLELPVKAQPADSYWDGFEARAVSAAPFSNKEMQDVFPVSMLSGKDYGFAVGVTPAPDVSFLENGMNKKGTIYYMTRFVVFPGKSENITFVLYPVKPILGSRDAVHGYYRRFPAAFEPFPGVDPRLTDGRRTDAKTVTVYTMDEKRALMAQQWYGGYDWFYCPYFRDGDYVGRKENWDMELSEGQKKALKTADDRGSYYRSDWEKLHKSRLELFRNADLRGNVTAAFYTLNHIEVGLAKKLGISKEYFFTLEDNGPLIKTNWTLPHTFVYWIFPWASPYEKILRNDLPEVVKELNLNAFAHDLYGIAPTTSVYRGKLDYHLPGWSYDEKGKFISLVIGHKREVEFVHSLRNNEGRPVGMIGNGGGHIVSGFALDASISEQRMTELCKKDVLAREFNRRLLFGHKPVFQHGYNSGILLGDIVPWETMTPEECRAVYDDFIRDYLIYLYQAGLTPSSSMSSPFEVIGRELPTMLEVMARGFEPASACIGNPVLQRVRYGAGIGAAIVLSNRSSEPVNTEELLIPKYLGETGVAIPSVYKGGSLAFTFDANGTKFPIAIPFMESKVVAAPVVLRTKQALAGSGTCITEIEQTKRSYRISMDLKSATEVKIAVGANTGFEPGKIICNGKTVSADETVTLQAGKNELTVETVSSIARSPMSDFAGFAFGDAVISLPDNPSVRESAAAQMFQDFVKFRLKKDLTVGSASTGKPVIRIARMANGEKRGVTIDGTTMTVRGNDPFDVQQVTWDLLRFLDRHDKRFGATPNTFVMGGNSNTAELLKKAGIFQKHMPDVKPAKRLPWDGFNKPAREDVKVNTVRPEDLRTITVPRLDSEPVIDGKLDDPIWKQAAVADGFTMLQTKKKPTQNTEAYIYRTNDAIFVGFKCHEANMGQILAQMTEPDSAVWEDDDFELRLAPGVKGTEAKFANYVFVVNPLNTMADIRNDANNKPDMKWNSNWTCKVHKDASFWSGEIRVPLKVIENSQAQEWRGNVSRYEKPNTEYSSWSPINNPANAAEFGILKFK